MQQRLQHYIDGRWADSAGSGSIVVVNPATEQPIAEIAAGAPEDVDAAVAAATRALPGWSALAPEQRGDWLAKIAGELETRFAALAFLASEDIGMPIDYAGEVQIGLPMFHFGNFAEVARQLGSMSQEVGPSLLVKEPVGVVGAITPWNFPLFQISLKVGAALAAGCTVVLKPSEVAPLLAHALADIVDHIGLPAGVLNIVFGSGAEAGDRLVRHPDVNMISFTGSTAVGKGIAEVASKSVKRVSLELGGKGANVFLDGDLQAAIIDGLGKCFINSGQICIALSRLLVPAERLVEAEAIASAASAGFVTGDPSQSGIALGPLVSSTQAERVRNYIQSGLDEGAKLVVGGGEPGLGKGYYVEPTVFSNVTPDMKIAREEIFGPVIALMPYESVDEAVAVANSLPYGLAAGVWSDDLVKARAVAGQLKAGLVHINTGTYNPAAPYGGYKESGYGREGGLHGVEEFLQLKTINLPAPA